MFPSTGHRRHKSSHGGYCRAMHTGREALHMDLGG